MDIRGKKIWVGLSGGVDSAVSASLLKEAGAEVTGVFIKGWYPPGMPCTWANDRRDAMRVAAQIPIPFLTFDASRVYKENVIDYLLKEYRIGRTPNPDIMCNRDVKFGVFFHYAKKHGADFIAMGHYLSGEKDQRYFLWAVPKEIIQQTIFPVGTMPKELVRKKAVTYGLPVARKPDSQGICFLGPVSVEEFLKKEFGVHPGQAIDMSGIVIGQHEGVILSTLGERVSLRGAISGPWFVQAKNIERNELVVSKSKKTLSKSSTEKILFTENNWLGSASDVFEAQFRYRGPRTKGIVEGNIFIPQEDTSEYVVPGQSIVFYDKDDVLLGGGIIS